MELIKVILYSPEDDIISNAKETTNGASKTTRNFNKVGDPGLKGEPNSSVDILNSKGELATRRWFYEYGFEM